MPQSDGPEPTNWELMRRLDKLDANIERMGAGFVTVGVYAADKKGNDERHVRGEDRLTDLEKNMQDADKLRRQQRLTVTLAFAIPIVTFVGNYFITRP